MTMHQGALDGLCGPYAIANMFELLGYDDPELFFQTACRTIAKRRWPEVLWDGTSLGDMQRMVKACLEILPKPDRVKASYPFIRSTPKTNSEYWKRFDTIFADSSVVCGIVGLRQPSDHWIVISPDGKRIMFWDTDPLKPVARKNVKSLFAGQRRQWPTQWLLERSELIVLSSN